MSWREFQLRSDAFRDAEIEKWKHTRMIAYYSLAATGAIDTRKMSIEKFYNLEGGKRKASTEFQQQVFLELMEKYNNE